MFKRYSMHNRERVHMRRSMHIKRTMHRHQVLERLLTPLKRDLKTQTIKEILLSNEKILEKISSLTVKNENQASLSLNDGNLVKKTFIDEIFAKLKTFPSFEKSELLDFVSSLCHYKENAIYNNQQKVFKNLFYKTNNSSSEKVYLFSLS